MSNVCEICGKHQMVGNIISHSNRKAKRVKRPNLQSVRVVRGGSSVRMRVCTRCIRAGRAKKG